MLNNTVNSAANCTSSHASASRLLWLVFVLCNCVFVGFLVGTRGIDIGSDTDAYALMFRMLQDGLRFFTDPGFALLTYGIGQFGVGLVGYQTVLFVVLLSTVVLATRKYFHYIGMGRGYNRFLAASLMLLFVSPFFVSASINVIRQGLSALIVFAALLSFDRRQWWQFVILGLVAAGLHNSALMYLAFAPLLWLRERYLVVVGGLAFTMYCSGLSKWLVSLLTPAVYQFVMSYGEHVQYKTGVRYGFALFSFAFFLVPYFSSKLTYSRSAGRIRRSAFVYLVALFPFFCVGWGAFSDRYLFTPWMVIALMGAAVMCQGRIALLRQPVVIAFGLTLSSAIFYTYLY